MKKAEGRKCEPLRAGASTGKLCLVAYWFKSAWQLVQAKWREQEAGVSKVWQRASGTRFSAGKVVDI